MDDQADVMRQLVAEGGIEALISAYLSPKHRNAPGTGCTLAALLPELAREPRDTREVHATRFLAAAREMASALPPQTNDPEGAAIAIYATLVGTLQFARAVAGTELSDRILAAGADAARMLVKLGQPKA